MALFNYFKAESATFDGLRLQYSSEIDEFQVQIIRVCLSEGTLIYRLANVFAIVPYVAVPGRNRTLFRYIFLPHYCVQSAAAQNFR